MNAKIKVGMRGSYTIIKRRNGKVLQKATFHNLITYKYIAQFAAASTYQGMFTNCICGSGSAVPRYTDTAVTERLWSKARDSAVILNTSQDKLERTWLFVYTFPASSSYVGNVTEIALSPNETLAITHALITDAEDMPIVIEKTEFDELVVSAQITFIRPSWQTGFTFAFYSGLPLNGPSLSEPIKYFLYEYNSVRSARHAYLSKDWIPEYYSPQSVVYSRLLSDPAYVSPDTITIGLEFASDAKTAPYNSSTIFTGYINSLCLGTYLWWTTSPQSYLAPPFRVLLPNADIFPITTLQGLSLGTGDGVQTDFAPKIPAWLANTEVVYNNGVQLTRGVDYLVDNLANLSMSYEVTIGNFICDIEGVHSTAYNHGTGTQYGVFGTGVSANVGYSISPVAFKVSKDTPLILTYAQQYAFSAKVNTYRLGTWRTNGINVPAGASLVFYYSQDSQETWVEFARIAHTANNGTFADTALHTMPNTVDNITNVKVALEDTTSDALVDCNDNNTFFGYVGEYAIRFLNPPALNDVLTIDMDIDRPYKDEDFIIQWNPQLTFDLS